MENVFPLFYFWVSSTLKLMWLVKRRKPPMGKYVGMFMIFLLAIFVSISLTDPIKNAFPQDTSLVSEIGLDAYGMFVSTLRLVSLWGILYFTSISLLKIFEYKLRRYFANAKWNR